MHVKVRYDVIDVNRFWRKYSV